jgi:hypothetical protein
MNAISTVVKIAWRSSYALALCSIVVQLAAVKPL